MNKILDKFLCWANIHAWVWHGMERECLSCGKVEVYIHDQWLDKNKVEMIKKIAHYNYIDLNDKGEQL